jgi:predicted GIY-YIG superfamily endonuclease
MTRAAVYRHFAADGTLLYVGVSHDPTRRLYEHKCRTDWAGEVARTTVEWFDSRAAAFEAERAAIEAEAPMFNRDPRERDSLGTVPLAHWLVANRISLSEFAHHLGVSIPFMSQINHGKKTPGLELAIRIEQATGGAVPCASWFPDIEPTPAFARRASAA